MIYATSLKEHVKIGALDRQITIRSEAASVTNSLGEVTAVTNTDVNVWASVINEDRVIGEENNVNDKQTVIEMRTFVIRFRTLAYTNKIIYSGATFDIIGIEEVGRRRFIKVKTKRVV